MDLELPEGETTTGEDLLGRYRGTGVDVAIGLGIDTRQLRNKHDVNMNAAFFSVGMAFWVGWETMRLVVEDEDIADALGTDR